ncbi:large subunit ribosomal protein L21 [Rhodoligotrophos appendicifer]|uniref:50S ribosomal protein L21 n=1 Tax=Rhodoligotrophos appendicifer TaxID=987056 RepID=UPI001186CE6E|nr:50S ribosomal protein L21 [Rhodoligotrophos appendicifer]
MYAVIKTGGKQYRVAADDVIQVERLTAEPGDVIQLDQVLMVAGEGDPQIGAPLVAGATVSAEVVVQNRGAKIIVYKKRRRKHYQRKNGHRQLLTTLRITEIAAGGKTYTGKAKSAKSDAAPAEAASAEAASA